MEKKTINPLEIFFSKVSKAFLFQPYTMSTNLKNELCISAE